MACSRPKRPVNAGIAWGFLSLTVLAVLVYAPGLVGRETRVIEGIGRAALGGGTVGRQALTASALHGLLPGLCATALAWAAPAGGGAPWSALLVASLAAGAALWRLGRYTAHSLSGGMAFCLVTSALCAPPMLRVSGRTGAVLAACLGLHALYMLARWQERRGERYLVGGALCAAATLLCGIDAAGWMLTVLLGWTASLAMRRATLRRIPGLLMLGFLPALYFTLVWMLLNRLIMGDALFFLRSLFAGTPGGGPGGTGLEVGPLQRAAVLLSGIALLLGLRRGKGEAALFGFGGLAAAAWMAVHAQFGPAWAREALQALLLLCGMFSAAAMARWWRIRNPALAALWALLPVFAIVLHLVREPWLWQAYRASSGAEECTVARRVERFVLDKKPRARIFVGGYDALALLGGDRRGRMQAVIDLHPEGLREEYWGQDLYLLLRRPEGKALLDNVFARFPNLYEAGLERTLYAGDWGEWRLFEMILAPSPRLENL